MESGTLEVLEVAGFDDVEAASLVSPAPTTVRQPSVEKGRVAARMLVEALENGSGAESVALETELVRRESTRS